MTETLLAPQTVGGASDEVGVNGADLPYMFHADPILQGSETADIQFKGGSGNWHTLWVDGFKVRLDLTRRTVGVFLPGIYRVFKSLSGEEIGIYGNAENKL